ncbi:hypothetical protein ACSSS7_004101 [Eimeria intestinalis]
MVPFFGIEPAIVDPQTGEEKRGNGVCGVLCLKRSWPGVCRTVHRAHKRLVNTYLQPYPGYYFTGDGAYRDVDGHYWITGRVDDTLNVSGHRLSTAEIEHALVQHPSIVEAAVVGVPHDVKGTAIFCFVIVKVGFDSEGKEISKKRLILICLDVMRPYGHSDQGTYDAGSASTPLHSSPRADTPRERLEMTSRAHDSSVCVQDGTDTEGIVAGAKAQVRKEIGPIATPDFIVIVPGLPKTQSGKIMRRLLRKLCCLDTNLGDTSSLANAEVLKVLQPLIMDTVVKERNRTAAPVENNTDRAGKRAKQVVE